MQKEDLLNEMYLLLRKFDEDMLKLMNLFRENGELKDEIEIANPIQSSKSMETKPETQINYVIDPHKCRGCTLCVRNCPVGAISGTVKSTHKIDLKKCISCGICVDHCKFNAIVEDIKVGDVFVGTVIRIIPIGAFVEFAPGKDGMIHISKLSNKRVEKVEDIVNVGDTVRVEVIKISDKGVDFRLLEKLV